MEDRIVQKVNSANEKSQQDLMDCEKYIFTFKTSQWEEYLIISIIVLFISILFTCLICIYKSK
jgi:hypothetical protein